MSCKAVRAYIKNVAANEKHVLGKLQSVHVANNE